MIKILIPIFTILLLTSCGGDSADEVYSDDSFKLLEHGQEISIIQGEQIKLNGNSLDSTQTKSNDIKSFDLFGRKEKFENKPLPKNYIQRDFIQNLGALTYKINELPGHILKYDEKNKSYEIVSLRRFLKDGAYPEMKLISEDQGILYSSKINSIASFNASALIGGLNVEKNTMLELLIQDVYYSIVPDSLILDAQIKERAKNLDDAERKNYFFVKGATLTLINNRRFKEQKFSAKVNSTYITAGGETYSSDDEFSRQRIVTVDLISLEELIKLKKINLLSDARR